MTDSIQPPVRRHRRWPLWLSLALNVLLIAFIVAGAIRLREWRDRGSDFGPGLRPQEIVRMLPPDARPAASEILRRELGDSRAQVRASREARAEVYRLLGATPFDADAFRAAVERMRASDAAIGDRAAGAIVSIVASLNDVDRKVLQLEIEKRMRRGSGRGRGDRHDPPESPRGEDPAELPAEPAPPASAPPPPP